jgi:hypothetical protein
MLVEANETFLKKDKALEGRSLVQASKNVFVRVMNPSADTRIIYLGTIVAQASPVQEVVNPNSKIDLCLGAKCSWERSSRLIKSVLISPSSSILLLGLTTS